MLGKLTDARRPAADHIHFDTLTLHQRNNMGEQGLLCSLTRGHGARAELRQRRLTKIETGLGFIQWLDNYNWAVHHSQLDTRLSL